MDEHARLLAFEEMLGGVIREREDVIARMAALKAQGKEKTVTYRQLRATKLELGNLLTRYRRYRLVERETPPDA